MSFAIVRTDRMHGTYNPADLVSVKYQESSENKAIENGRVVLLGALDTTHREVFIGGKPAVDSDIGAIALIATPELMADERKKNLNEFRNEAGEIARGYRLRSGDIFSVTAEALTAIAGTAPATGQVVELQADTKLKLVTTLTLNSTQVGEVLDVEGDYIVILVK